MNAHNIKIVTDSSADTLELPGVSFSSAPLRIITASKEYIDNEALDVSLMAEELLIYKGKSSTTCPSVGDWIAAFGDAEYIFCITITSALSGSFNSACIAKREYEEEHPGRRVFVIDSLSAGPGLRLIAEKLREYILSGDNYDIISKKICAHMKKCRLLFMLESMRNFANNGRVSPLAAKAAGFLGIRIVGRASKSGTLELLDKCRGEQKALSSILGRIDGNISKVRIAHCDNESAANALKELIAAKLGEVDIAVYPLRGLCSFYAEKGGILIGIEEN